MGGGVPGDVSSPPTHPGWDIPVELGAFHQRVGVPVADERAAVEAAEALGVVLLLPGHLRADAISPSDPGVWGAKCGCWGSDGAGSTHGCPKAKGRAE